MRSTGTIIQKFLLGAALVSALAWNLVQASEIKAVQLASGATGTRAEIALGRDAAFNVISLAAPDRLVVDLPASSLAKGLRLPAPSGIVRAVRTGAPTPGTARIVFDLAQPVAVLKPRIEQGVDGPRLVLEWPGDGTSVTTGSQTAIVPPAVSPSSAAITTPTATVARQTPDPAAASSEATSRLISELAAREQQAAAAAKITAATPAATPIPSSAGAPAATRPAPAAAAPKAASSAVVAGAPARIMSGAPATMPGAVPAPSGVEPNPPATAAPSGAVKTIANVMRGSGLRPLVIAIDAGHGGQDPGAIGPAGSREKDVTLAIARELARQINATPGMKAYLTRDADMFLPLERRARLARTAKADMFVSIHADAAENRNARGSSVYVLSLKGASSQRARWLADKENSADLIGGVRLQQANNTLASVLLDLTQSGHMKASEDAANHVLDGLKRVGANHKPQIERANFAVLRTSDMPSMLVETAFISNAEEERRLIDPAHQRVLARAVLDGVNTYFTRQPPPGTMYAARAEAAMSGAAGGSP